MWVSFVIAGGLLMGLSALVLARSLSPRSRSALPSGNRPAAFWSNRWVALSSALLGLILIAVGGVVARTPARRASEEKTVQSSQDAPAQSDTTPGTSESPGAATYSETAAASPGSEADSYRSAVIGVNDQIGRQLARLTDQLVSARYEDEAWVAETKSVLAEMSATVRQARTIVPTAGLETAHAAWMEGIESYDWAAQNMIPAIEGPDFELMRQCTDRMTGASTSFQRAMELMQQAEAP